jgi:hypothetical protein
MLMLRKTHDKIITRYKERIAELEKDRTVLSEFNNKLMGDLYNAQKDETCSTKSIIARYVRLVKNPFQNGIKRFSNGELKPKLRYVMFEKIKEYALSNDKLPISYLNLNGHEELESTYRVSTVQSTFSWMIKYITEHKEFNES